MLAPSKPTDAIAVEDAGRRELPNGWALATIRDLISRGGSLELLTAEATEHVENSAFEGIQ